MYYRKQPVSKPLQGFGLKTLKQPHYGCVTFYWKQHYEKDQLKLKVPCFLKSILPIL